jgi:hypothetical protein
MNAPSLELSVDVTMLDRRIFSIPEMSTLGALFPDFVSLGHVATSALYDSDEFTREAGQSVLGFLRGASKFIAPPDTGRNQPATSPGQYDFYLTLYPEVGRSFADNLQIGPGTYAVRHAVVGYRVQQDEGARLPVDSVDVGLPLANNPNYHAAFARLSCSRDATGGPYTLRAAYGYMRHDGRPVPDAGISFGQLSAIGDELAKLPMARPHFS